MKDSPYSPQEMALITNQLLGMYGIDEEVIELKPYGSGHIHKTFFLYTPSKKFILQGFNKAVFTHPDRIGANLQAVQKTLEGQHLPFELPLPIPTITGESFATLNGELFRLFPFVNGLSINSAETPHQAYLASKSFGEFIKACASLSGDQMIPVIDGFHDLALRYRQFENALKASQVPKTDELMHWVKFYQKQVLLVRKYRRYTEILPWRVTHNDTKINNVIYDADFTKINAVIDLDTVMGGYVFYDFGDLVRTVACTEEESSTDWEKVNIDLDKYEALLQGFQEALQEVLSPEEIDSLTFGGEMMACIMGLRFLTDYLNGNIYYPIKYPMQNFDRAKNQALLLMALQEKRELIEQMVKIS
ncbi:mucin desulfatase [Echinicola pacifica]|uniref:Mucin desulfatase n=1 Tax=Echinicola pacifica TaxID=346377 RepID=A0A918UM74_9BACT|nr:aminoglycoside phosphotransferase family protein [Echinicola pacifica]GGZ20068.1 mucin desulfatase [Echinicola pacifica]